MSVVTIASSFSLIPICDVAADKVSVESLWFIKINNSMKATEDVTDDYSNTIPAGHEYL